jgi:hypothetical protein
MKFTCVSLGKKWFVISIPQINATDDGAKVRTGISVCKQCKSLMMERFNLAKLKNMEGKEQYRLKSQRGLQLWTAHDDDVSIIKACETIQENINIK